MCVLRCLIPGAVLLEFRGAYSQSRVSSHPDNADAVREILQSDEIHALQYRRQARYRHQNRCESRMITTGTLASDPVMHQHSGHHLLCEPHRPAASQGMSVIRMCRFLYAQTCATCRMGGASPSTFADLCTDVCPDMHQSSDAGRHHRYAASSPGLRRPRHTERAECHDVMPVSGAFRRIVYATAYRTVRGVKRQLNPALHGRTHVIQWPEPRIQQRYHSAVRDTGHWTRPAAGISHIQRLLQSPFIFHRWCRRRAYR